MLRAGLLRQTCARTWFQRAIAL